MYMMYVDESGDPGVSKYSSSHFILSGLIINSDNWLKYMNRLKKLRSSFRNKYGLRIRTEIHAAELIRINKLVEYREIKKRDRISLLKDFTENIPRIFSDAQILNICLKKTDFSDLDEFQTVAWQRLIQRYDNFLKKDAKSKGIIISDDTNEPLVRKLIRKMRIYNPVNSHFLDFYNAPTDNIIEDVFMKRSENSYMLQVADVVAHLLYRREFPKGSLRKYGLEKLFEKLEPILLKKASSNDKLGIVRK